MANLLSQLTGNPITQLFRPQSLSSSMLSLIPTPYPIHQQTFHLLSTCPCKKPFLLRSPSSLSRVLARASSLASLHPLPSYHLSPTEQQRDSFQAQVSSSPPLLRAFQWLPTSYLSTAEKHPWDPASRPFSDLIPHSSLHLCLCSGHTGLPAASPIH